MSLWNRYESRMNVHGSDKRSTTLKRESRYINTKLPSNLSYHVVDIDGNQRNVAIINSDLLDTKTIFSLPGEGLSHGGLVKWEDNYWLITELDYNREICTKGVMRQCNYLLRWIADDKSIIERWCIVEDGTKYLIGESGGNDYFVTSGDSRITLTISKDKYSICLNRNNRFLINDYDSPNMLSYRLTKPFKLGGGYNSEGVLHFVLKECNSEDSDNFDLHIANYYDYFPKESGDSSSTKNDISEEWI